MSKRKNELVKSAHEFHPVHYIARQEIDQEFVITVKIMTRNNADSRARVRIERMAAPTTEDTFDINYYRCLLSGGGSKASLRYQ